MKTRIALLWLVALTLPLLVVSYVFFPQGATLIFLGQEFTVQYPDSWKTFVWMMSIMVVPAITATTLLFTLSRISTPWQVFVILFELLLLMIWNMDRLLSRQQYIEGHRTIVTAIVTCVVAALIFLLWKRKQKSEREKKEALLKAIDQLTMEDLPELFSSLMDIEITTEEMKETDFVWALKKMLQQNIHEPKVITTKLIQKLTNLKTDNT